MGESRWMKQTNSKIRIGPEYQAVLPDLSVPEKDPKNKQNDSKTPDITIPSSSSNITKIKSNSQQNHGPKSNAQSSVNNKSARSEKESPQLNKISTSELSNKPKSSVKTQKAISKAKTSNKSSSRTSK
ncbi:uncharacterized protein cubi_03641 [Cryptosporidium ubiquitum]|uniref:ELM2 domain-containing protein n=1 Tax=Cryptosporidium ubiquitum TaxID=857276 RepID=A0A1J4MH34_9CRYT|nr:uncharacterized protein cubi_03641 [Cryptosporidium ubiquitum]OII72771.1 hypothetical protein cubi_03641 [Cryptosporidium ubiquitum]